MSLQQAFGEFLAARKAAMRATFLKARGANVVFNVDTVRERLLTIAHTVAGTVYLIHSLFTGAPGVLQAMLTAADLHATTKAVTARLDLSPLPHDAVQTAATQLVDTFADYVLKVRTHTHTHSAHYKRECSTQHERVDTLVLTLL